MKQTDQEFWVEQIQAQKESGLSIKKFCTQEGLIEGKFYYWKKAIGKIPRTKSSNNFIQATDKESATGSFTITLQNSMSISFEALPEPHWFGKFLKACSDASESDQV